ncbi:MAG: HAD family hydrolase [Gemmataceae bacterium]|nr:HAD family hydrolase [Gemmataceae bacterium]
MRLSFDLDDTLICYHPGAVHEPNRVRWWLRPWVYEPLRLGAAELLAELAQKHEIWVYTTSYRSPWNVSWWLWCYGARVGRVINQDVHERVCGRRGPSKVPGRFGIDLHIDDSWGVWAENRLDRNVCVVQPTDPDWAAKVQEAVERVARGEAPPIPPDVPEEYVTRGWV